MENVKLQTMSLMFGGVFCALPFMPFVWRAVLGGHGGQRYPGLFSDLLSVSSIWWGGSIGCAIVLFAYNFCPRLLSLRREPAAPFLDPERRNCLRKGIGVAATAPFMLSGYGVFVARLRFELEHFAIGVSGLSSDLSQFTIAQLTDIHLGPFMPPEELARYV